MQQINQGLRGRVDGCRMDLRKIDSLIAEKVMGWKLEEGDTFDYWVFEKDGRKGSIIDRIWKPTKDIADAWEVVEKIRPLGLFKLTESIEGSWWAEIQEYRVYNESAPLAICLAALKAVGVEVDVDG